MDLDSNLHAARNSPVMSELAKTAFEEAAKAFLEDGPEAAMRAAGIQIAVGTAMHLARPLFDEFKSPTQKLVDALNTERQADLERYRERIEGNMEKLLENQATQAGVLNNLAAVFAECSRARSRTADDKKARLLMGALCNAFDPEIYKQGLTLSLIKILADLDYGDIHVLAATKTPPEFPEQYGERRDSGSLLHWHQKRLHDRRLVHIPGTTNVVMVLVSDSSHALRTELGERLLRLIGDEAMRDTGIL